MQTRFALATAMLLAVAPIEGSANTIYDFEDGTPQGWALSGAFLRDDSALKGAYAVFGVDAGSMMRRVVNWCEKNLDLF